MNTVMFVAQAADTGIDFARLLGTGGPLAGAGALLGYLAKLWADARKEKREGIRTERESESGIVETTRAAIQMVREQMLEMDKKIQSQDNEISTLRALREQDAQTIGKLERRVRELETENEYLKGHRGSAN